MCKITNIGYFLFCGHMRLENINLLLYPKSVDRYKGVLIQLDAKRRIFGVLGRIYASLQSNQKHPGRFWTLQSDLEASWTHFKRPGDSLDGLSSMVTCDEIFIIHNTIYFSSFLAASLLINYVRGVWGF